MAAASIAHAHDPARVTVGVDTHKDTHVGHAKDELGRDLGLRDTQIRTRSIDDPELCEVRRVLTSQGCISARQDRELLKLTEVWDGRIGCHKIQYHLVCASGEQRLNSLAHAFDPTPGNYGVKQSI
jgi:hypothetical protein